MTSRARAEAPYQALRYAGGLADIAGQVEGLQQESLRTKILRGTVEPALNQARLENERALADLDLIPVEKRTKEVLLVQTQWLDAMSRITSVLPLAAQVFGWDQDFTNSVVSVAQNYMNSAVLSGQSFTNAAKSGGLFVQGLIDGLLGKDRKGSSTSTSGGTQTLGYSTIGFPTQKLTYGS